MRIRVLMPALLTLVMLTIGLASAQALTPDSGSNITIRPFLVNLNISPSETTKQFDLTINNGSKFDQIFHLSATDFGTLNETGGLAFQGANASKITNKYGLTKWIDFGANDIQLGPGRQATIKVTINNDRDLASGAHYAAIITTASNPISKLQQLTITPKVSSLVFVNKLGGEFYDIHLASVSTNGRLWRLPTSATIRLKSNGNTYIIPRGVVNLRQSGKTVARGIINGQSSIVLPQTIRSFDVPLTNISPIHKGVLFTSYSIQVDYRYDGIDRFAGKLADYYTLNYYTLGALAALVLAALFIYRARSKKLRRRT
jgi:hypothetical protein